MNVAFQLSDDSARVETTAACGGLDFVKRIFSTMRLVKQKVFAYITHNQHLLVFNHPFASEAGIQVPVGTIEEGEHPETAVLREAFEETGLNNLTLDCFLGEQKRDMHYSGTCLGGGGGEAHHETQKASSTKRVLEAKKRPVLNIPWSPRGSDRGDAVENGCEFGDVPTRTCER